MRVVLLSGLLLEALPSGEAVQLAYGIAAVAVAGAAAVFVTPSRSPDLAVDRQGGLLALVGLSGLVLGLPEHPQRGQTDPVILAALALGLAGPAAFVGHELETDEPMLDLRLFRSRGLSTGSAPWSSCSSSPPSASRSGPAAAPPRRRNRARQHPAPRLLERYGSRAMGSDGKALMALSFVLQATGARCPRQSTT